MKRLQHQMIEDFHEKFGVYPKPFSEWTEEDHKFRLNFLKEELKEYETALAANNKEEMFDALIDLTYVAMGTAHIYDWDFEEGFRRVHAANMAKRRVKTSSESKRGSSLDIMKPPGWRAPVLIDLVKEDKDEH